MLVLFGTLYKKVQQLEMVQHMTARFVTNRQRNTSSVWEILQLKTLTLEVGIRSRSRNILETPSDEMHWLTSLGWYGLHVHSIVPMDVPRGIDRLTRMWKLRFFTRKFDWNTFGVPLCGNWILSKTCTPNSAGKYQKSQIWIVITLE